MIKDKLGNIFTLGCKVARAVVHGSTPEISICTVTKLTDDLLYLDNSKVPVKFPSRLLIIEQDPLVKMFIEYNSEK